MNPCIGCRTTEGKRKACPLAPSLPHNQNSNSHQSTPNLNDTSSEMSKLPTFFEALLILQRRQQSTRERNRCVCGCAHHHFGVEEKGCRGWTLVSFLKKISFPFVRRMGWVKQPTLTAENPICCIVKYYTQIEYIGFYQIHFLCNYFLVQIYCQIIQCELR